MSKKGWAPDGVLRLYLHLGENIRGVRQRRKWTQARLANEASLSRASVASIEMGRQQVLLHTVYQLAAALGTDIHELLPPPDKIEASGRLVSEVSSLSPDDQSFIDVVMTGRPSEPSEQQK